MNIYLSIVPGLIGMVDGFLAQRSRMCFVAWFRDYLLMRDKKFILGLFMFIVTIWVLTSILYAMNIFKRAFQSMVDFGKDSD